LSSVKTLVDHITAAGLNVDSIENIGPRTSPFITSFFSSKLLLRPSRLRTHSQRMEFPIYPQFQNAHQTRSKKDVPRFDRCRNRGFQKEVDMYVLFMLPLRILGLLILLAKLDYFAYTEAGFSMRNISDHVFVITREVS
jgi:hypothetical protein